MGYYLSTTIGRGIAIPYEFERKIDDEQDEANEDYEGFGEWLDEELRKYEGLSCDSAYFMDYSPAEYEESGHVVFIKSTTTSFSGADVARLDPSWTNVSETAPLFRFCEDHGLDFNDLYGIYTVVSYG